MKKEMEEVHTKEVCATHVLCLLLCSKDQRISKDVCISTSKIELKIVHKVDNEVMAS